MNNVSVFSYQTLDASSLPPRPADSHKGTFGKVLCVCGSRQMSGAAYFAAKAAYRIGAGLCRILTVRENIPILATLLPEALLTGYDGDEPETSVLTEAAEWADVLVIGCGLGVSAASRTLLFEILSRRNQKPCVLDADALNLLSKNPSFYSYIHDSILTPHAMEMARLCHTSVEEITQNPEQIARDFANRYGVVCVLKGHHTVVSDGGRLLYRNQTGNSGMATGGSGDVLAGMVGGLLAQSRTFASLFETACRAVFLHGACGDLAAKNLTEYSVMAEDLLGAIPEVLSKIVKTK